MGVIFVCAIVFIYICIRAPHRNNLKGVHKVSRGRSPIIRDIEELEREEMISKFQKACNEGTTYKVIKFKLKPGKNGKIQKEHISEDVKSAKEVLEIYQSTNEIIYF